jgi:DNA-binding response OmpR family regulator
VNLEGRAVPESKARLLIVDDVTTVAAVLRMRLEAAGYDVSVARDGDEALRMARENRFDLMILDLVLPGVAGESVCRTLRGEAATRTLPILVVSARAGMRDREHALAAGADAFFSKPYDAAALLAAIAERLARAKGRNAA